MINETSLNILFLVFLNLMFLLAISIIYQTNKPKPKMNKYIITIILQDATGQTEHILHLAEGARELCEILNLEIKRPDFVEAQVILQSNE